MANLTNYHSHCDYCDGRAPMEEFVRQAIQEGFTSYGISSHAPLDFAARWALKYERVDDYLRDIAHLKQKYAGQIEIYAGLEIDYLDQKHNPANNYFQALPLDFRIGSVHLLGTPTGEMVDIDTAPAQFAEILKLHFGGDLRRMVETYYEKMLSMVATGGFDFMGHADKISYNASRCQADVLEQVWYRELMRDYFKAIAASGVMMEINTKLWHQNHFFFPNQAHFKTLQAFGIPVVVNSDAHRPEWINHSRGEALQALREAGFATVRELHQGHWVDVPIG